MLVKADRVATEAALDVLLENVAVHGGGEAEIRWEESGDSAVVAVIDHGQPRAPRYNAQNCFDHVIRVL